MEESTRVEFEENSCYYPDGSNGRGESYYRRVEIILYDGNTFIGNLRLVRFDLWRAKRDGIPDVELFEDGWFIGDFEILARRTGYPEGECFFDRINIYLGTENDPYGIFIAIEDAEIVPEYRGRKMLKNIMSDLAHRYYGIWFWILEPNQFDFKADDKGIMIYDKSDLCYANCTKDFELAICKLSGYCSELGFGRLGESNVVLAGSGDLLGI